MVLKPTRLARLLWSAGVVFLACADLFAGSASDLAKRFQAHIDYLASDELQGRAIGTPGLDRAAEYIKDRFVEVGLEPAGENGTYFQSFRMTLHRRLTDEGSLTFHAHAAPLRQGVDFIPFNFSSDEAFKGDVVFCGYGIVAEDKDRDDFAGVDLAGNVALILRGEPPSWIDEEGNHTRYAALREKVYNAKDRDAVAVLFVNQAPGEGEPDELTEFVAQDAAAYGIPAFHILRSVADARITRVRGLVTHGFGSLDVLQEMLDAGKVASTKLTGITVSGKAAFKKTDTSVRNVLGLVRGDGPRAEEAVVIGAHYDHLGLKKPMMRKFKGGKLVRDPTEPQIHNGADDNASGTAGLIEIAHLFAKGPKPKRSILFIAFTAEETGVHGSKHYVEHPLTPLDRTVAMLNMDMIGRLKPGSDRIQVFGVATGKEFDGILAKAAEGTGLTVAPSPGEGGGSDHAPFVRHNVPSMHFFTGHHSDYHKPTDDSDKINAEGGAQTVSLVYRTALALATRENRPTFQVVKRKKDEGDQAAGTPTYRVVMGLAPAYGDDGKKGMGVDGVTPEGPADMAGMKAGDRIIRIGGKPVANIYDYMGSTRNNKAGDTVEVVVLRDGREVTLQVKLAPAR